VRPHIRATQSRRNLITSAIVLACVSFAAGAAVGPVVGLPFSLGTPPITVVPTFRAFWETWNLVDRHYVDRSAVESKRMTYGAIEGMLDSLGDVGHTRFLSPQELEDEQRAISGQLEGIGAQMVTREQGPTILAPLPDSPAQRAGLMPGDLIVRVDGRDVAGMTLDEVVRLIRGPAGTSVTLTVLHPGETTLTEVTVTRARVTVPSVTWAPIRDTTIAHVLVSQFSDKTGEQLASALRTAQERGITAIVFDLRNNPGGLRDEAVSVASQFLSEGIVLIEQDAQGKRTEIRVRPGGVGTDLPLVTLVNEGSASSAEIVAGALQDHSRATLVGTQTVGTGTVLSTFQLSDGSAIRLGVREWFTPNGNQIWHRGITPDVAVALPPATPPITPVQEANLPDQDVQASNDTQLLRAIELLTTQ